MNTPTKGIRGRSQVNYSVKNATIRAKNAKFCQILAPEKKSLMYRSH